MSLDIKLHISVGGINFNTETEKSRAGVSLFVSA